MNAWIAFLLGALIGYGVGRPNEKFWNQDVQIYGGSFTSSPVADVWGYADDWEGCRTLAAGANFVNAKEREMASASWQDFINEWAVKGNTYCVRKR